MAEGIYNTSSVVPWREIQLFLSLSRARTGVRSHLTSQLCATALASAWLPDSLPRHPLPNTSSAVVRTGVRSHSTSQLCATAPASALSPASPPRHPLPHTSSAVTGLVSHYYHLLHLLHLLHLHHTVACHGTGIGFVTQFPATVPATSHFLGGRALRRSLPLHLFRGCALQRLLPHTFVAGLRSGVGCHQRSQRARAPALAATPPTRWARASAFAAFPPPQRLPPRRRSNFRIPRLSSMNVLVSRCLRRARFVFRFPWRVYIFWPMGKMAAPWGWYGEEERIKPAVLKC